MRITPEWNFMEHDTFLVIGWIIKPKTEQVSGMQHASSSDSREVHVARVKLISFFEVTTKLGPIPRSAWNQR